MFSKHSLIHEQEGGHACQQDDPPRSIERYYMKNTIKYINWLDSLMYDMQHIGASTMTWRELLHTYASEIDRIITSILEEDDLCWNVRKNNGLGEFECSRCKARFDFSPIRDYLPIVIKFCPNCSAEVVDIKCK